MEIELRGASKSFGTQRVLRELDLHVPLGTRLALSGPNGSGKSTLLRVLMGLLSYEGLVRVGGACPMRERERSSRHLAYVPQVAPQLGASVREVVRAIAILRGLELASVAGRAEQLGLDLDAVARKPFRALSGGMKQKLLIAIALSCEASLLILDEPTASLDREARARFRGMLERDASSATLVLCSHHPSDFEGLFEMHVELVEGRLHVLPTSGASLPARAHAEPRESDDAAARARLAEGHA